MDRDLYADLGVSSAASPAELKAAWHRAARLHPDTGGDSERFLFAKLAYDFLADPQRRSTYDAARAAGTGRSGRGARDSFDEVWNAWQATIGEVLPQLSALRGSAKSHDWLAFAEGSFGLINQLRGKRPASRPAQPPGGDLVSRLRELQTAHAAGLLTAEEYLTKRATLLAAH